MNDKQKTPAELQQERRDAERFGDDPNAIDRLKFYGYDRNKDGKWFAAVGDEFFEVDEKTSQELENEWKQAKK